LYLYEGTRLFARGAEAGVHVYQSAKVTLDLLIRHRFDRLETAADDFYRGMDDRRQSVDAGVSLAFNGSLGMLSLTAVTDVLGRHEGQEVDLSYRYPLAAGRWRLSPYVSLVYQSADLTDYYYGVRPHEAAPGRAPYQADGATLWRAGLEASYRLSRGWHLHGGAAVEQVPDTVRDSPLTDEDWLLGSFVGASVYEANAISPEREPTWSWRLNAGYTAEHDFHNVLRFSLEPSDDVDTYLAGVTLGRLLDDRGRFEYWARASVNRRFERGNQDDFFEYVGYGMVMGRAHSPWSRREWLRYGLGFGFSYGAQVPWIEQIKQQRRERDTSRLLVYMEAQFDVPLRNLFGGGALEHCYTGLSLVHRSGVFGAADLLGNVSGGSNVVTGHVECGF